MRASVRVCLIVASTQLFPPPAASQAARDRAALDWLRDSLERPVYADSLLALPGKASDRDIQWLREGMALLARGKVEPSRGSYDEALRRVERALDHHSEWPYAWYALGLIRLAMSERRFVVKATPYHGAGISYRRAAMDAFARAIRADSSFVTASAALGSLIAAQGHRRLEQDFAEPMLRALGADGAPAVVSLARFRLEFGAGHYQAALEQIADFEHRGGDKGTAGLERARAFSALGQTTEAVREYLQGVEAMESDGRSEFRADLAWVAADSELVAFDSLPLPALKRWIASFWRERDALAVRRPNERLAEHLRRWVFVHQHYLIHRPDDAPIHAEGMTLAEQTNSGENFRVVEALVLNDLNVSTPNFKAYRRAQWEVDDRGVIYLRHGPPTRVAIDPSGPPNESWQYDMPEGSRIFHFLGSRALGTAAATTLVAALPLTARMLDSRGGLDARYSAIAADLQNRISQMRTELLLAGIDTSGPSGARTGSAATSVALSALLDSKQARSVHVSPFHPEVAYREIARGREAIAVGVTTDGFPLRYKEDLGATLQAYGVGFAESESPRVLAVFAVPGVRLTPRLRPDGGPGVLYSIQIRLIALDRAHGTVRQIDTTRTFRTPTPLGKGEFITGLLEMPIPPGHFQVRALVTAPGIDAATAEARDSVMIPTSRSALVLSDLVLGLRSSGLRWSYEGQEVYLNPLNAFPMGGDVELFHEVGGLRLGKEYQVTTSVRKAGARPQDKPAVQSSFTLAATGPYQQVTRGVGLANLKPGAYLLEVTVRETGTEREVTRRRALNILEK